MPIHPDGTLLPFDLDGRGTGVLQTVTIAGSPHTITAEGHRAFGGTDSSPSPLDYVLAALVSCNQVTARIVALGADITLGEFHITAHAVLDNSVLVLGAEGNPNFTSVDLAVEVETDLDDEAFQRFVDEVNRRCPLTQLYVRSGVAVTNVWKNRALTSAS